MKLISIPLKNISGNIWRSLTFGVFIFFGIVSIILLNSLLMSAKSNMEDMFINSLVGHVQIRSARSKEEDMFTIKHRLADLDYIKDDEIKSVESALNSIGLRDYTKRVRLYGMFVTDNGRANGLIIGLDLKSRAYKKSFVLTSGRFPDPDNRYEMLLSEELANRLQVKAGDSIGVLSPLTKDGYTADLGLTVVGIGNVNTLTLFGFMPAYMDLQSAQELMGYTNEVSDFILYIDDKSKSDHIISDINSIFGKTGVSKFVKVTGWKNMGGFVMSIVNFYKVWFYGFIFFFMIIISILIINLIFMMGLERRQEIGTMRAIGFSQSKAASFFMMEILSVTVIFSFLGILAGVVIITILNRAGISFNTWMAYFFGTKLYMKLDAAQIATAIILIFGFTVLAALYPSYRATSMKPAQIIQET